MQRKRTVLLFVATGLLLVLVSGVALMMPSPASAQCGSQASSCKNCHEVQGQMPVNADGTGWHQSHAFGDFCYICHGGNNQAKDKDAAHQGMVAPLSDIKASCQQCHVSDLEARAQVYASVLGVEVGSGSGAPAAGSSAEVASAEAVPVAATSNQCNEIVVDDPNAVDFKQNYDAIVLGRQPVNWGNMILLGMIGVMAIGGGGFVVTREKLINVKFGDTRAVDAEYPSDVVALLPKIAALKSGSRKALAHVLENKKADKVLDLLATIVSKEEE